MCMRMTALDIDIIKLHEEYNQFLWTLCKFPLCWYRKNTCSASNMQRIKTNMGTSCSRMQQPNATCTKAQPLTPDHVLLCCLHLVAASQSLCLLLVLTLCNFCWWCIQCKYHKYANSISARCKISQCCITNSMMLITNVLTLWMPWGTDKWHKPLKVSEHLP